MSFLYPQFLWALTAISIPIIIHLFNFRRFKRIYFSNVSMLKEVDLQTNKQSKLRNLLVLITRILAIASLVIAFAQPYFPNQGEKIVEGTKSISMYIDNSFSMEAESPDGNLLYLAKEKAIQVANSYKPSDEFLLLTNDFEGKHQRFVSRDEFIKLVEEIEISPKRRELSKIYDKQKDLTKSNGKFNCSLYWLSDFQKSTVNVENLKIDTSDVINLVQLEPNSRDNIFIDSIWFTSPVRKLNKEEELHIKVVNQSDENLQVRVELSINESVKSFNNLLVESNSFGETILTYKERDEGIKNGKVSIGEYPNPTIGYDDNFYFGYNLKKGATILAINANENFNDTTKGYLNQLFKTDDFFTLTNVSSGQVNYADFNKYSLIVLNNLNSISSGLQGELFKYVDAGGTIALFPGEKLDKATYNEFLLLLGIGKIEDLQLSQTKVVQLNYEHELYANVFQEPPRNIDLPDIFSYYKIIPTGKAKMDKLMTIRNGDPFLSKFDYTKGKVYLFSVPLDKQYSNLPNHSIFVATMLRIAETSGLRQNVSYTISDDPVVIKDENFQLEDLKIKSLDKNFEFIPEAQRVRGDIQLFYNDQINEAGNYILYNVNDLIGAFGLNYDRKESQLDCYKKDELIETLGEDRVIYKTVSNKTEAQVDLAGFSTSKLWKWFVWLALLFLLIEIALLRFLK